MFDEKDYFIENQLIPALFDRATEVFPEMEFQSYTKGWRSRFKLDLRPSQHGKQWKTFWDRVFPFCLHEWGEERINVIKFYGSLHGKSYWEAVDELSRMCGLTPPTDEGWREKWKAREEKQGKLETMARKMAEALYSPEGKAVLDYLKNTRGYTDDFINYAGLGFCSKSTAKELESVFNDGSDNVTLSGTIGTIHTLSIPYRSGGRIYGFNFRTIQKEAEKDKYRNVYISGTDGKKYHLFGLTGLNLTKDKDSRGDMVVVEGELDALRGQYAGLPNVVAAGGSDISNEALAEAKRKGIKTVTLLFDTGERGTDLKIKKTIKAVYEAGLYPFVAEFPSKDGGKVDMDSYLRDNTGEDLKKLVYGTAVDGVRFLVCGIFKEAKEDEGSDTIHNDRAWHKALEKITDLANAPYISPTDRVTIFKDAEKASEGTMTEEAIREEADIKKAKEAGKKLKDEVKKLSNSLSYLADNDETESKEIFELLQEKVRKLQDISPDTEFSKLLTLPTANEIIARFKERPTGIPTNYAFGQGDKRERLFLQSGALTYICAPTSHGKSRMLENLALQLAISPDDGVTLYFTFEEDKEAVTMQFLNMYIGKNLSRNNLRSIASYYYTGSDEFFSGDSKMTFKEKEPMFLELITSGKLRIISENYDSKALISAIRYLHKNLPKVKAVFIDYIQLLHTRGAKTDRKGELADMCRELMATAKDTGLPIILAAQLNRDSASPLDITAQNIAEASEIEQSANTVMMLWNSVEKPSPKGSSYYYKPSGGERKLTEEGQKLEARDFHIGIGGKMYAKLVKNRGGERNIDAIFEFNGNTGRITQPDYDPQAAKAKQEGLPSKEPNNEKMEMF